MARWLDEARKHYVETPEGLRITYDPALREAFLAAFDGPPADLWPLFDALAGLPLALIRGANSDLLSAATAAEDAAPPPRHELSPKCPTARMCRFWTNPKAVAVIRAFLAGCT